ncbi:MAG TPA: hypothetical protein VHW44_20465 [Pseudonocardiaceae bacterium]|nr:hypothetical protein [Pseudonocardiaceae bacterium]
MDASPHAIPGPPPGAAADQGRIDTVIDGVRQAAERVADLDHLPLPEHVVRFDAVHATLTDALSSIDKV